MMLVLVCSLVFSFVDSSAHADSHEFHISLEDHEIIDDLTNVTGMEMASFFVEISHNVELCPDSPASTCSLPLRLRTQDYNFFISGHDEFDSAESAQVALDQIHLVHQQIFEATGIRANAPADPSSLGFINFVFVNEELALSDIESFVSERVALRGFNHLELRREVFLDFLRSEIPFFYGTTSYEDGIIRDAHIYVRSSLDSETMRFCIVEEMFNSFGLDEGREFDTTYDWLDSSSTEGQTENGLSRTHSMLLRLLYSGEFSAGQSAAETAETIFEMLSRP